MTDKTVERIRERIAELVDPSWDQQSQQYVKVLDQPRPPLRSRGLIDVPFDPDRHLMHPWFTRTRTVEYPSLIRQLELAVAGSSAGVSSSGYGSRPVVSVPAVDALGMMHREAIIWLRSRFRVAVSSDTAANLVTLAGRVQDLDEHQLSTLDGDVLRWWGRARIVTTWDSPPLKPHVPCMACEKRGGLRVKVDRMVAVCLDCGATWDSRTIGILGSHVQLAMADQIEVAAR